MTDAAEERWNNWYAAVDAAMKAEASLGVDDLPAWHYFEAYENDVSVEEAAAQALAEGMRVNLHPLTYRPEAGGEHPAAIIDKHPMAGYVFIEYIDNGTPRTEQVEGRLVS